MSERVKISTTNADRKPPVGDLVFWPSTKIPPFEDERELVLVTPNGIKIGCYVGASAGFYEKKEMGRRLFPSFWADPSLVVPYIYSPGSTMFWSLGVVLVLAFIFIWAFFNWVPWLVAVLGVFNSLAVYFIFFTVESVRNGRIIQASQVHFPFTYNQEIEK